MIVYCPDPLPPGLLDAFLRYENALGADDLAAMDELFVNNSRTLRGDEFGLLVSHRVIHDFRASRGGAPSRTLGDVQVQVLSGTVAVIVAVTEPASGGHGLQTQVWRKLDGRWQICTAHVSAPSTGFDSRVWRVVGDPLLEGTQDGPLLNETVAVKDLFPVAGFPIGAGVPAFLRGRTPEPANATALQRLLDAGASVRGIARTDQLAYSLAGDNPHYGTPINPAAAGALPGGSSSGSATAVALGAASIGLATDTAGSIRVPASYQGLWGLRTTHGAVPTDGLVPLAPDFDTVGLLTRTGEGLARAAAVLLAQTATGSGPTNTISYLMVEGVAPDVAHELELTAGQLGAKKLPTALPGLDTLTQAFRVHQGYQAWAEHGEWLTAHPDAVKGAAALRFQQAAEITAEQDGQAVKVLAQWRHRLDAALGDGHLLVPAAPGPAPRLWADEVSVNQTRAVTMRLTAIAGVTGRPAVARPWFSTRQGPVGLCLIGPRGSDLALIEAAASLPLPT